MEKSTTVPCAPSTHSTVPSEAPVNTGHTAGDKEQHPSSSMLPPTGALMFRALRHASPSPLEHPAFKYHTFSFIRKRKAVCRGFGSRLRKTQVHSLQHSKAFSGKSAACRVTTGRPKKGPSLPSPHFAEEAAHFTHGKLVWQPWLRRADSAESLGQECSSVSIMPGCKS